MSFHKIAPVAKKNTKPAAPAPKKKAPQQKKARPVGNKNKGC
ncbi:hypothetical protein [Streptomyces justiciae]|uniref:Uncharacterized protein n=1 Tax=Streptomyces justiciae TaxID=2780140 RepID=A0ABU3M4U5_9ACTN|nr:hypothetical protein [Streptomyces justiciae]MCW8375753.1 hypothetical protein [Streptomyces justiciae]MDT7845974.1 hypothetical protein [Streptomyces justiciae]